MADMLCGVTLNRLVAAGLEAVGRAARAILAGDADLLIAGGVESMSRAPFVMPKPEPAFSRANAVYDTTIGWRLVNPRTTDDYSVDSMPHTGTTIAQAHDISLYDPALLILSRTSQAASPAAAGGPAAE